MRLRALLPLLLCLCAAPAWGQASPSGSVRTEDGLPLPQIAIAFESAATSRRVVTGPDGRYLPGAGD